MFDKNVVLEKKISFAYILLLTMLWFFLCFCESSFANEIEDYQTLSKYLLGLQFEYKNQLSEAVDLYQKALQSNPHNLHIHQRLASIYFQENKLHALLGELETMVALSPDNQEHRYVLAELQASLGSGEKAIEHFEKMLHQPLPKYLNMARLYAKLGDLYFRQKKIDQAVEAFQKVLEWDEQNSYVRYFLGFLYTLLDETSLAMDMYRQCIRFDFFNEYCLNALGYLYVEENIKLEEAEKLVKLALRISPQEGAFLDSLGWVYYRQGKYYDALKYLSQAVDQMNDPTVYQHLGQVYGRLGAEDLAQYYEGKSQECYLHYDPVRLTSDEVFRDWHWDIFYDR